MAGCEFLDECSKFFNTKLARMPSTAQIFKLRYCEGNNSRCARYLVCTSLCKEQVPIDLFPNHTEKAHALIACG